MNIESTTERLLLDVTVPLRIESEANRREHWARVAKRKKLHRATAAMIGRHGLPDVLPPLIRVHMLRLAPRKLDDDNLASGFKAVRDGIADALGIDDGSPRIRWEYGQELGKPRVYGARVRVWGIE